MNLLNELFETIHSDPTPVRKVIIGVHWTLVMVLGPSTPMSPVLFERGVSLLSGSRIIDEDAAIATIQQGATFPQVKGVRLVTMAKGV